MSEITTTPQLTESEIDEIQAASEKLRQAEDVYSADRSEWYGRHCARGHFDNVATFSKVAALIRDLRALRAANKALAADVVTATNQAHKYRDESESLRNQQWTAGRVIQWLDDPLLKPANIAFTAGNERQIAYRVERLREQLRNATERFEAEHELLTKVVTERNELREQLAQETQRRIDAEKAAEKWYHERY